MSGLFFSLTKVGRYNHRVKNVYSDREFPWSFYFNGEIMPKWGACWGLAHIGSFHQPDGDIGHREIYGIYCEIDHVGIVESADPDVFVYSIQEVLCILLNQRDTIFSMLAEQSYGPPDEIYSGLVETALRMRELAITQHRAFWTSGDDEDRGRLVGVMRRCESSSGRPENNLPPHILRTRSELLQRHEELVGRLHQLAQSCQFDTDLRKRLHKIRAA